MKHISRRNFVKAVAATGAISSVQSSQAFSLSNDEIRVGFVGCGGRAGEHLGVFSKLDGVKIAGLCDPDSGKVAAAKEKFGRNAKGFSDLRAMIDDKQIDAVVIAACNHWHCLAAIWAMQAGRRRDSQRPFRLFRHRLDSGCHWAHQSASRT